MSDYQNDNSPNGVQNDSRILSLFDVLVDEYERQVKTHGLKPLYTDGEAKTDNVDWAHEHGVRVLALRPIPTVTRLLILREG
jgi:hypothetical protein